MNLKIEKYMLEIWKTVVDKGETYDNYQVSNLGRIMSLNYRGTGRAELMTPSENNQGYLVVSLWKNEKEKCCRVHRLVAETFLPNPEGKPCVNHKIEGDKGKKINIVSLNEDGSVDFEKSTIEWATYKENNNYGTRIERAGKAISKVNINGKCSKKVLQFTLDGVLIREWPSIAECGRNGFVKSNISACCRGKQKSSYGFKWQYA